MAETKFDEVGARFMVDGKLVDANGNEIKEAKKPAAKQPEPKDYSSLNTDDFLAAVKSGELSKEDALTMEQARVEPRKGVLDALNKPE